MTYYPQYPYMNSYPLTSADQDCRVQCCTLRVAGRGSVTVQPDIAQVLLGVATENMNLTIAQTENAEAITSVIHALRRMGVASQDIATQSYTISPQYDYIEGQQIFRGYRVVHTLNVTIRDTGQIGPIIDAAVAAGANFVNDIRFTLADPTPYYQRALNLAVEDAVAKAMTIGRKLNVNVSPIPIRVTEETFDGGPLEPVFLKTADAATPIQVGQLEITASIEAIFTYNCQ